MAAGGSLGLVKEQGSLSRRKWTPWEKSGSPGFDPRKRNKKNDRLPSDTVNVKVDVRDPHGCASENKDAQRWWRTQNLIPWTPRRRRAP
jgi:hypothetical protein